MSARVVQRIAFALAAVLTLAAALIATECAESVGRDYRDWKTSREDAR